MENIKCEELGKVNKAENEIILINRCKECGKLMEDGNKEKS
jgi:hypothetical protein